MPRSFSCSGSTNYAFGIETLRGSPSRLSVSIDGKIAYPLKTNLIISDFDNLKQPLHVDISYKQINSVSFSPDGSSLAYGTLNDIKIINTDNYEGISEIPNVSQSGVTSVYFSSNGKHLISATKNSEKGIRCYIVQSGKMLEGNPCNYGDYNGCIVSDTTNRVIGLNDKNNSIMSFKFPPLSFLKRQSLTHPAMCGIFIGDSSKFIVPQGLNKIGVYNFESMEPEASYTSPKQSRPFAFCKSPFNDNIILSVHGSEKNLRLWDIEKGEVVYTKPMFGNKTQVGEMPVASVWHKNEILVATLDSSFYKFDARSAETIESVEFPNVEKSHFLQSNIVSVLPETNRNSFIIGDMSGNINEFTLSSEDSSKVESHESLLHYKGSDANSTPSIFKFDDSHLLRSTPSSIELLTRANPGETFEAKNILEMSSQQILSVDEKRALIFDRKTSKWSLINVDDPTNATEVLTVKTNEPQNGVYSKSSHLFCLYYSSRMKIYKFETSTSKLEHVKDIISEDRQIEHASFSADGAYLAIVGNDGVRLYSSNEDFKKMPNLVNPTLGKVSRVAWSPIAGEDKIAIGYLNGSIAVSSAVDVDSKRPLILNMDHKNRMINFIGFINKDVLIAASSFLVKTYQIS